ncbi:hypothetical protein TNCV_2316791 [Trichonephila clavipes]|nr:hypothetical protein TNCV_2316791 [Trichonephila clavipes]
MSSRSFEVTYCWNEKNSHKRNKWRTQTSLMEGGVHPKKHVDQGYPTSGTRATMWPGGVVAVAREDLIKNSQDYSK